MRVEYCNMQIASTNFAKTLVGKRNMTSYYDIENSVYTVTMTTIRHCSILEFGRAHTIKQLPRGHHQTSARRWSLTFSYLISNI